MTNEEELMDINITAMPTPNPNTVMFTVERNFFESGSIEFEKASEAESSVLPKAMFAIKDVVGVMLGVNFISITKTEGGDWEDIFEVVISELKRLLASDEVLIDPELVANREASSSDDSESVQKIKKILDDEIRPAIAMDGGDCSFHSFIDGILTLRLQGACSTCPASTMTLKMGIENRLKEDIPELKEVIQL
ncbi:MAG: Fe-S cluster biogenesis protein NfuA [Candidatus Marinamargulisbacteria bacterium]|jgi:Fe-S cluster biogenesis protein NfuA